MLVLLVHIPYRLGSSLKTPRDSKVMDACPERGGHRAHAADPDLTETMPTHTFMELALDEAYAAADAGEVPIGCVIVCDGDLIAQAGNRTLAERDPTAHAEMVAIRRAAEALGSERLVDCDLYVTLEPCTMCAAAISFARIRRLYYGAADPKGGAVESGVRYFSAATCLHRPEVYGGIGETEAAALLRQFFAARR
jgi:tRNA(adenine34) deaminase